MIMVTSFTEGTSCTTLNASIPDGERFSLAIHRQCYDCAPNRHRFSLSAPCISETTGENAQDLASVGRGQHLNASDPFDPFKAATAWGD